MFAKINGRDFEFTANETILDVARRNDIHIPTLCELHDIDHARAPAASAWSKCAPATPPRRAT